MKNLILHIPHSSKIVPVEVRKELTISDEQLSAELLKMTDAYTDELFPNKYPRIVFRVSRLVCDPERFRDDEMEPMAFRGMGAVYTRGFNGKQIREIVNREHILKTFYDTHHANFEALVETALHKYGSCLIVDCHSFSGVPLPYEESQDEGRPDICIGTDDYHTPECTVAVCKNFFEKKGYSVQLNSPYAGTIVPIKYYKKKKEVCSIMIEINRDLYMDEQGNHKEEFLRIQKDLISVCSLLEKN